MLYYKLLIGFLNNQMESLNNCETRVMPVLQKVRKHFVSLALMCYRMDVDICFSNDVVMILQLLSLNSVHTASYLREGFETILKTL